MKHILAVAGVCLLAAAPASGALLVETWGGKGPALTHPGTLKVVEGDPPRLLFDLSAVPDGAKVRHASLFLEARQPVEPIRIVAVAPDASGAPAEGEKPLALEPPLYRSFDATAAVRRVAAGPGKDLALALAAFRGRASAARLEVRYEGRADPGKLPPQVEGLKVIHAHGQTALIWKELPCYRPRDEETIWVEAFKDEVAKRPGKDRFGNPRPAAVRLKTLRRLQGLAVRDKALGDGSQRMPPFKRLREVPQVRYRVYRSRERITSANIADAQLVGESKALDIYQSGFVWIHSWGEYRDKWEDGKSVIPTFCVGADYNAVRPGEAFYVHTPTDGGKAYYAVTAVRDGTENAADVTAANSLDAPVAETVAPPRPVRQFVRHARTRYGKADTVHEWFAYWAAPPMANLPDQRPRRIVWATSDKWKAGGPLAVCSGARGPGWKVDDPASAYLYMEAGGGLGYSQGRGTLRSHRETRVEYYQDRYVTAIVNWALGRWEVDRARIVSNLGMHYTMRHPEMFPVKTTGPYEINFDMKWNPASGTLRGRLGPADIARTVDGHKAWDIYDVWWFLAQDPGRDVPFFFDCRGSSKDAGHGAEYGWQDDGKGYAAFRVNRQPYVGQWGGGRVSGEVRAGLTKLRWDRSVPAFSNCNLDNNPGNGDPDDGDPVGQINGYLFWEYETIVDEPDRWEMTVYLVGSCPEDVCIVDVTPRHCRKFKPRPGRTYKWTNTRLADKKVLARGTIDADRWGLTTLKAVTVTKGRNRIVIAE